VSPAGQADSLPPTSAPGTGTRRGNAYSRRPRALFRALLAAAVVLPLMVAAGTATAAPTKTKAQLKAELAKAQKVAEAANERYMAAQSQLDSINVRIEAAKARQATQQKAVKDAQHAVAAIAAETYRAGDLSTLAVFLGDDPSAMLAQAGMMATLGDRQAAAVGNLQRSQKQLEADSADLFTQQQRLQKTTNEAKAAKKEADAKQASVKVQLARFTAAEITAMNTSSSGVSSSLHCGDVNISAPSSAAAKAIRYACSKIGSPYVYGAEGPSSFDCSGLTQASYRYAGITLPRTAAAQASAGTRVSASNLKPGDLVFFHSPISHVGIYIGSNLMIHAPHTGDHVRIASSRSSTIVAATRVG
jgi:peptidoglycan DL-endopeptidase CwlO